MSENASLLEYLQVAFKLAKEYFIDSEERNKALMMLIVAILCIFGMVATTAYFSSWWVMFWGAFEAKSTLLFISSMELFTYISLAYLVLKSTYTYLVDCIKLNWRQWLTKKLIEEYLEGQNNFLDLSRFADELQNPAQRIHQDLDYFVELSVNLSLNFIQSMLTQVTFITTLWYLGGSLSLTLFGLHLVIPGYLVWIAVSLSLTATYIKLQIGQPLTKLNNTEANVEAEFRTELEQVALEAEGIALERGQNYYKQSLFEKFKAIYINTYEKIKIKTMLAAFDGFYNQFSWVFPYLAAAPIYFTNIISLGQLMQIGYAFGEVNTSFNWFMNRFGDLAWFKTNIRRITELREMLKNGSLNATPKNIHIQFIPTHQIIIDQLSIERPQQSETIFNEISLTFNEKENTIIAGPSGAGKSTLFKSIAGIWQHGHGQISLPQHDLIYFLSQKPTIPKASLKQVLSFPLPQETYTDEQYKNVLKKLGNMEMWIPHFNEIQNWSNKLSGGQKQKIAFARAFLLKPKWLFLDESTASLDETSETIIYQLLKQELTDTTFISIAHRESVQKFHDKTLTFFKAENGRLALDNSIKLTA